MNIVVYVPLFPSFVQFYLLVVLRLLPVLFLLSFWFCFFAFSTPTQLLRDTIWTPTPPSPLIQPTPHRPRIVRQSSFACRPVHIICCCSPTNDKQNQRSPTYPPLISFSDATFDSPENTVYLVGQLLSDSIKTRVWEKETATWWALLRVLSQIARPICPICHQQGNKKILQFLVLRYLTNGFCYSESLPQFTYYSPNIIPRPSLFANQHLWQ